jgi:hypothetical protein
MLCFLAPAATLVAARKGERSQSDRRLPVNHPLALIVLTGLTLVVVFLQIALWPNQVYGTK